jgi:glyoxylase-like metal-dependent hydrolase (beta-lactamase superfamily II)
VLCEIAPDLWGAEEPLRYLGFEMGRRMTIVRLAGGELLVHSPASLSGQLRSELDQLGEVRFVVPASILHGHFYMEQYREAYPRIELFKVPGLERKRPDLRFDRELTGSAEPEWSEELDQKRFEGHRVAGRVLNEVEFFHRKTRTLITGDLCFNIGPGWPLKTRLLAWGPRMRPRLGPTVAFRLGIRERAAARRSVERILEWDFDRILPGHGEIVSSGGKEAFARAFAWLLR